MKNFEFAFLPPEIEIKNEKIALLKGVQVVAAGYFPEAFGHEYGRDPAKFTVVIFCTAGKGYYQYKNKTWEINAGEILYCLSGTTHRYWADKENPWTIFWLHVQGKEVDWLLKEAQINLKNPVLNIGVSPLLISLFRETLDIMKEGFAFQNSIYASAMVKQILSAQIYLMQEKNRQVEDDVPFRNILKLMSEHVNGALDITKMAKHCHLSKTYFIRKFKQNFGYSPIVYFNRLKIESACQLLLVSNRSVKEISYSLGFEDPLYFSRLFRKVMGQSPSDYRQAKKK